MFALQALILILSGLIMLRLAGKKVITEMTPLELVTTLAIGTIVGHADNQLWKTVVTIMLFVGVLVSFQYLAMKSPRLQRLLIGKSTPVIENGQVLGGNLAKLRMTTEQLEMRIRQNGIANLKDIQTASIEVNGQLGYILTDAAKPVTNGDLKRLLQQLDVKVEEKGKEEEER